MLSNGNVNIYTERVSVDIGEHESKVSAVIKFNSSQSEFTIGLVFVWQSIQGAATLSFDQNYTLP